MFGVWGWARMFVLILFVGCRFVAFVVGCDFVFVLVLIGGLGLWI